MLNYFHILRAEFPKWHTDCPKHLHSLLALSGHFLRCHASKSHVVVVNVNVSQHLCCDRLVREREQQLSYVPVKEKRRAIEAEADALKSIVASRVKCRLSRSTVSCCDTSVSSNGPNQRNLHASLSSSDSCKKAFPMSARTTMVKRRIFINTPVRVFKSNGPLSSASFSDGCGIPPMRYFSPPSYTIRSFGFPLNILKTAWCGR